jgi:hypothetical protein
MSIQMTNLANLQSDLRTFMGSKSSHLVIDIHHQTSSFDDINKIFSTDALKRMIYAPCIPMINLEDYEIFTNTPIPKKIIYGASYMEEKITHTIAEILNSPKRTLDDDTNPTATQRPCHENSMLDVFLAEGALKDYTAADLRPPPPAPPATLSAPPATLSAPPAAPLAPPAAPSAPTAEQFVAMLVATAAVPGPHAQLAAEQLARLQAAIIVASPPAAAKTAAKTTLGITNANHAAPALSAPPAALSAPPVTLSAPPVTLSAPPAALSAPPAAPSAPPAEQSVAMLVATASPPAAANTALGIANANHAAPALHVGDFGVFAAFFDNVRKYSKTVMASNDLEMISMARRALKDLADTMVLGYK